MRMNAPRPRGANTSRPAHGFSGPRRFRVGGTPCWAGSMVLTRAWCRMPSVRRLGAPKGQPQASPGQRPGSRSRRARALKGAPLTACWPEAMVWFALSGLDRSGGATRGVAPGWRAGRAVGASGRARRRMSERPWRASVIGPTSLPGSTENVEEPESPFHPCPMSHQAVRPRITNHTERGTLRQGRVVQDEHHPSRVPTHPAQPTAFRDPRCFRWVAPRLGRVHGFDEGMVPGCHPSGVSAPQRGSLKPARGNAGPSPNNKSPEGACHSWNVGQSHGSVRLSGLGWIGGGQPGALPRAGVGRAVGASGRARRRMSESMACLRLAQHPAGVHRERRKDRKPLPSMSAIVTGLLCGCCSFSYVLLDFVEQLEALAEHEVKFIINKVIKNRNMLKSCC
jgi:hypothetical protein